MTDASNGPSPIPYETIAHTADLALRISGRDLPNLFVNAARAMFDVMAEPPGDVSITRQLTLDAEDMEALLVDWLNDLIYLHETEGETYADFTIDAFSETHLVAHIAGGRTVEKTLVIKAATYHELQIRQTDTGYQATVVFDI